MYFLIVVCSSMFWQNFLVELNFILMTTPLLLLPIFLHHTFCQLRRVLLRLFFLHLFYLFYFHFFVRYLCLDTFSVAQQYVYLVLEFLLSFSLIHFLGFQVAFY